MKPRGEESKVVKAGDTVRRPMGDWSPTVHDLLRHLAKVGFEGSPRVLGIDDQSREILTFLEGTVPHYPMPDWVYSNTVLAGVSKLIRRYHDATASFSRTSAQRWQGRVFSSGEVICHNDLAPYNTVFRSQLPIALIDFDLVAPGPRTWDLAYVLYRFVPLCGASEWTGQELDAALRRLPPKVEVLVRGYGMPVPDLVDTLIKRVAWTGEWLCEKARQGDPKAGRQLKDGHAAFYGRESECLEDLRVEFCRLLS